MGHNLRHLLLGIGWIALSTAFSLGGDVLLKKSAGWDAYLLAGVLIYAAAAFPVAYSYRELCFANVAMGWQALVVISSIGIANRLFHERITPWQWAALACALASIILASVGEASRSA